MGSRREHWYSIFETPAPTTPHPCREITNTSGGIQTGVTQLLRPVQLPLEEQVGTHPWHPQKAPYSSQHWLIPSRKEASASLPYWPWGPSCYRLFSWTSSECTRIKEDPGGKSRVPTVGGGGGVCVQGPSGGISGGEVKCPHGPHGFPLGQSGVVLLGL